AALVAERDDVLIDGAALRAHHGSFRRKRIRSNRRAAGFTCATQVMEPFQVSALALPVSDGVADEFECRYAAKVRYRENRIKNGLQGGVFAFLGQHVHLQEPLVAVLLYLDEIGDLDARP